MNATSTAYEALLQQFTSWARAEENIRVAFVFDSRARRDRPAVQAQKPTPIPSSEAEYLNIVNDFWFHTVWTAKHLRRGELWWAKSCCDGYLKNLLLRMLEFHARATKGPDFDTWMSGRFLETWADPRAVAALP